MIHILQQGLQSGFLKSLTPPEDTLGSNRFQTKVFNTAEVPMFFATKVKEVMDNLPASIKLLTIPTYLILIPRQTGGVGSTLDANVNTMMQLTYDVSGGCPGNL